MTAGGVVELWRGAVSTVIQHIIREIGQELVELNQQTNTIQSIKGFGQSFKTIAMHPNLCALISSDGLCRQFYYGKFYIGKFWMKLKVYCIKTVHLIKLMWTDIL